MKNLLFTLAVIFCLGQINGQNYNFGKVSKAELQEKFHPTDSSASAAILYKKERVHFFYSDSEGFMQEREIHERIKIYNKEGFDWATKKVYLYKGNGGRKETLGSLKAITFNLIDNKVEKDKLSKDGKFSEDYSEYTSISSFTMPNIKEGSVIEYKYTISSPLIVIDDVIFQYNIPINKLEVNIETPEYYVYNKQLNLKASYLPKIKDSYKNTNIPFNYKINIIKVDETNVPALKREAYAGNINNFRSKMGLELTAILNGDKVVTKSFSANWEEVVKTIYESDNFGGQLKKSNFYKDELNTLLEGVDDDFEKAVLVDKYVKSKVKWNGNYGKYSQEGVRSAYKNGVGNAADINLLVVSMLRSAGVKANPVLISTRNNGIPIFPTREGFNYVICFVQKGDEYGLIDATEANGTINVLPERVLNWQGRLVLDRGISSWINIMPTKKTNETTMLNVKFEEDFTVSGKVMKKYTSNLALAYRNKYNSMTNEDHIKSLESDKGDIEVSELQFNNQDDYVKPVTVAYEYELSDAIDEIGDRIYFDPLLFFKSKENPFKLEERTYPIDFVVPFKDVYTVNIMLPEGYKVESLPQAEAVDFNNGAAKFLYNIKDSGKFLRLKIQFEINNPLILPVDYTNFKDFYSKIVEKQGEQIVLTKA